VCCSIWRVCSDRWSALFFRNPGNRDQITANNHRNRRGALNDRRFRTRRAPVTEAPEGAWFEHKVLVAISNIPEKLQCDDRFHGLVINSSGDCNRPSNTRRNYDGVAIEGFGRLGEGHWLEAGVTKVGIIEQITIAIKIFELRQASRVVSSIDDSP